jgi:hypothetical protein
MPRLSVWFIRSALIYMLLGFTLGGPLLWHKGQPIHPVLWQILPARMEFLLLGWTVQLAMGVAYWILPRFRSQRRKTAFAWLSFGLLNAGIWLVVMAGLTSSGQIIQVRGLL